MSTMTWTPMPLSTLRRCSRPRRSWPGRHTRTSCGSEDWYAFPKEDFGSRGGSTGRHSSVRHPQQQTPRDPGHSRLKRRLMLM
ncbi:hypothetical protein EJB05_13448 [Eragrostis curvula]|uniref:Uncharacterized protein n=1 Tax=Eragrostis curvula TaxID=38414 RepID=A0A5J9VWA7_9POAL|nr:hypothetical protein EJB05_13448 [Eragrostis curvula]